MSGLLIAGLLAIASSGTGCASSSRLGSGVGEDPVAPAVARGVVYEDANRNGRRDPEESGIPGVAVSNGDDVVLSDDEGRYALPVDSDTILFVVKPRDWMTPTDSNGLPLFHYIHKPEGSRDRGFRYKGVAPTGALPASVDFALYPRPDPERFDVIVFADPQPYNRVQLDHMTRDTVTELIGTDAAFGLSVGDLVGDDLDLFDDLNEVQGLLGIPWYNAIGNHDQNYRAPDDEHSDETFERVYGPPTYAFQWGAVHFIVIDDVYWHGFRRFTLRDYKDRYTRGFREDQLRFVSNYLASVPTDDLVVLAMHMPLRGRDGDELLLQRLSSHPRVLSLVGHNHSQAHDFLGPRHGYDPPGRVRLHQWMPGAVSGSRYAGAPDELLIPHSTMSDGTPNGYGIVSFEGNGYSLRYKASRRPADYQLNVFAPYRVKRSQLSETRVFANVFAGNRNWNVEMRVGTSGEWSLMKRVYGADPQYVSLIAFEEKAGRALPWKPSPSAKRRRHVWRGTLPSDLARGVTVVEVRATDPTGRHYIGRAPIRIR